MSKPKAGPRRTSRGPVRAVLAVGALGVVFGDIGTSPLYAIQSAFALGPDLRADSRTVLGLVSLICWTLAVIVTLKYVTLVMRASDQGEGGILVLASLVRGVARRRGRRRLARIAIALGVVGASLFAADSLITPAISVLSAVEGLAVSGLESYAVPLAAIVLSVLFWFQRQGTGLVGRWFGPVMAVWFLTLAALGLPHVLARPDVLWALSPSSALEFMLAQPVAAFVALGAVVLSITGAEALYADLGHFGTGPIRLAWLALVFPALILNYLGQGALLLANPGLDLNPFFALAPESLQLGLVALATVATIIASQSVISGTFSMARQASGLGYLPHLVTRSTSSTHSGQIYLPAVNTMMFVGVLALVFGFRSSTALAGAYGLAVTSTFLLTTFLLLTYSRLQWRWHWVAVVVVGAPLLWLEASFVVSNMLKIPNGGWLPIVIAIGLTAAMNTWHQGQRRLGRLRRRIAGPLPAALQRLAVAPRTPGTTIYPHRTSAAPLAMALNERLNRVATQEVVIVHVEETSSPRVAPQDKVVVDALPGLPPGVLHLTLRFGFHEHRDVPAALAHARGIGVLPADLDLEGARYVVSAIEVEPSGARRLDISARLFEAMSDLSVTPVGAYHLPIDRTVQLSIVTENEPVRRLRAED